MAPEKTTWLGGDTLSQVTGQVGSRFAMEVIEGNESGAGLCRWVRVCIIGSILDSAQQLA